jgi:hypothetical protein
VTFVLAVVTKFACIVLLSVSVVIAVPDEVTNRLPHQGLFTTNRCGCCITIFKLHLHQLNYAIIGIKCICSDGVFAATVTTPFPLMVKRSGGATLVFASCNQNPFASLSVVSPHCNCINR